MPYRRQASIDLGLLSTGLLFVFGSKFSIVIIPSFNLFQILVRKIIVLHISYYSYQLKIFIYLIQHKKLI